MAVVRPEEPDGPAIRTEGVSRRFGRVDALIGLDLEIPRGKLTALLGPNGAGKSTLIDILCTLDRPDEGRAFVGGVDVVEDPFAVRLGLGVVFQEPTIDTRLTVAENLDFHARLYRIPRPDRAGRITEALALVELEDRDSAKVATLSSGMRRRLEIARALMHRPRILMLDEPTVGLDAQTRARIWDSLERLRTEEGISIVVTSHYIDEVDRCDQVRIIDHGKIIAKGSPVELKAEHGRSLLRLTPRDETTRQTLKSRFPSAVEVAQGQLVIDRRMIKSTDALLAEFGNQFSEVLVDPPSLESVFLTLTGRDLRVDKGSPDRNGGPS